MNHETAMREAVLSSLRLYAQQHRGGTRPNPAIVTVRLREANLLAIREVLVPPAWWERFPTVDTCLSAMADAAAQAPTLAHQAVVSIANEPIIGLIAVTPAVWDDEAATLFCACSHFAFEIEDDPEAGDQCRAFTALVTADEDDMGETFWLEPDDDRLALVGNIPISVAALLHVLMASDTNPAGLN